MTKYDNKVAKYDNKDWALYIAKLWDLDAKQMDEVLSYLNGSRGDIIFETYGSKLDEQETEIFKRNYAPTEPDFEYYEIENTVDERGSKISGRYTDLDTAREALKNCADWYCSKGTGTIYKISLWIKPDGSIKMDREQSFPTAWRNRR